MKSPLQITFHNLPHSEAVTTAIHTAMSRLEAYHDRIMACRVVVDQPHRHHREGNPFQIRIDLTVPGSEFVVKRESDSNLGSTALEFMVQDAFEELHQQLDGALSRRRGFVKSHEVTPHARVSKLIPEGDYGFLSTPDGRELFFHRNSVLNGDFKHLDVGTEVSFVEELGDKGPQASTVKIVGRHNRV